MATANFGFPLPLQTTAPPDVVKWLTDGLNAVDTTVKATNDRILYGPVASVPATLATGQMYLGY